MVPAIIWQDSHAVENAVPLRKEYELVEMGSVRISGLVGSCASVSAGAGNIPRICALLTVEKLAELALGWTGEGTCPYVSIADL
jgi:hypothetical protein